MKESDIHKPEGRGPSIGDAVPDTSPRESSRVRYGWRGNHFKRDVRFSTWYHVTVDEVVSMTWRGPEYAPARM